MVYVENITPKRLSVHAPSATSHQPPNYWAVVNANVVPGNPRAPYLVVHVHPVYAITIKPKLKSGLGNLNVSTTDNALYITRSCAPNIYDYSFLRYIS